MFCYFIPRFLHNFSYLFHYVSCILPIWQREFVYMNKTSFQQLFWKRIMILAEDDDPCRGWWSWQRIMILAEDHVPGRGSWSWQNSMFLLEHYDSAGKQRTTVQGPPWDHFWQNPKFYFPSFGAWFGVNVVAGSWVLQKPLYRYKLYGYKMPAAIY